MNLYNLVLEQFNTSINKISHDKDILNYLSEPKHEIITNFPVRLDTGEVKMFRDTEFSIIIRLDLTKEVYVLVWMLILMK